MMELTVALDGCAVTRVYGWERLSTMFLPIMTTGRKGYLEVFSSSCSGTVIGVISRRSE